MKKLAWAIIVGVIAASQSAMAAPPDYLPTLRSAIVVPPVNPSISSDLRASRMLLTSRQIGYEAISVRSVYSGNTQDADTEYSLIYPGPEPALRIVVTGGENDKGGRAPTYGWSLSFHGIEALHNEFRQVGRTGPIYQSDLTSIQFRGDWARMPVGVKLGWSASSAFIDYTKDRKSTLVTITDCVVAQELPATTVAPTLEGSAKKLNCDQTRDGVQFHYTGYYLEAYSWFIELGADPNGFYYDNRQVIEIR